MIDVAAIRANGAKYGKRLLKILTKMDPVLFGPRYVGKKQRSYSGLCQKNKQRPIPITELSNQIQLVNLNVNLFSNHGIMSSLMELSVMPHIVVENRLKIIL